MNAKKSIFIKVFVFLCFFLCYQIVELILLPINHYPTHFSISINILIIEYWYFAFNVGFSIILFIIDNCIVSRLLYTSNISSIIIFKRT